MRRREIRERFGIDGGGEEIQAGNCPECGIVAGDCVEWNFPNPATCSRCGSELITAGVVTAEELAAARPAKE